jgi:hypothetical protein
MEQRMMKKTVFILGSVMAAGLAQAQQVIDSGYINPKARTATVYFHAVRPIKIVNLLSGMAIDTSDGFSIDVDVPCGLFRFLDIELDQPFTTGP